MPLAESLGTVLHKFPALIGRSIAEGAHPLISDHGMVECLHFLLQVLAKLRPLLPVAPLHRLHILRRRVVEVGGETLLLSLGLDLREDFRLLLGAVGLGGLFILFPQGGQHMTVLVRRRIGVHHRG